MPSQIFPFDNSLNYTIPDPAKLEITGGKAQLKDQIPSDATFYAGYDIDIDGDYGGGILTGTPTGGADVADGYLDLAHGDIRYVDYDADLNADSQQTGCVRIVIKPNYSGAPSSTAIFWGISEADGDVTNEIRLKHNAGTGALLIEVYDENNILQIQQSFGNWLPTVDTDYELEFNWDFTTGANRVFIDGTQHGVTETTTLTRSANIGILRIGRSPYLSAVSNYSVKHIVIFNTVQHTSDYTPTDWSEIPQYSPTDPYLDINSRWYMDELEAISAVKTITGSDQVKIALKKGTQFYYISGGVLTESDGTYSQSITIEDWETYKALFTSVKIYVGVRVFLHSNDGSTTPSIDTLTIQYSYAGESPDTVNTCLVWYDGYKDGGDANLKPIKIYSINSHIKYKNQTRIFKEERTIYPDSTGYWEIELVENENMEGNQGYVFEWDKDDKSYLIVPDQETININDLEEWEEEE